MLIAYFVCISKSSMTDSMNFGPEWLRNLSSDGSVAGSSGGGAKYQLADYRYGREDMLALYEKGLPAPPSLASFTTLYSEQQLTPLSLLPQTEEEIPWQTRPLPSGGPGRGRGTSLERGRASRGRGGYQSYNRPGYDNSSGWGNGEHSEWSPRKDYGRTSSVDNWRRNRGGDEDDGWRSRSGNLEKWGRSSSWREDIGEDRGTASERSNRGNWNEGSRGPPQRRQWDPEDHLPEWAMENPSESGGTFDASGAFHGSDDEQRDQNSSSKPKREPPLQKSASVQNISDKLRLQSSQSLKPLSTLKQSNKELPEKHNEVENNQKQSVIREEKELSDKRTVNTGKSTNRNALEPEKDPPKTEKIDVEVREGNHQVPVSKTEDNLRSSNRVDEDFDRLQEDLVQKLVVEEDIPKKQNLENFGLGSGHTTVHPPPNLVPPVQNSWFYQDPQGDLQGPFPSSEMAEWYKAGYFSMALLVKRQCDEGFYRLGDLVSLCNGDPFQSAKPVPPLKPDMLSNLSKQFEMLQRQLALSQATTMRSLSQNEFWSSLNALQQRELIAQHMLTQPQISPDLRLLQQAAPNPLMHMINQMQQSNKLPSQEKPPTSLTPQLDPIQSLIQQMGGNLPTIPSPLQPAVGVGGLPTSNGLPPNLQAPNLSFPNIPVAATLPTVVLPGMPPAGMTGSGLPGSTAATANMHTLPPRPNPLGAVDPLSTASSESDPIKSLLRQLQNNKTQQATTPQAMDSLWQSGQQFTNSQSKPQWQQQNDSSVSMWDIQTSSVPIPSVPVSSVPPTSSPLNLLPTPPVPVAPTVAEQESIEKPQHQQQQRQQKEDENSRKAKEEREREQKAARELEEQREKEKREAERRKKEEQRKQEAEKRAAEEKRKKEEERMKKELERAKKEAEEKRLKELEEKRRLKEQRKAEEEARKKVEEKKKQEEEKARQEAKEKEKEEQRRQEEKTRQENSIKISRVAPWSQTNPAVGTGTSLAEIQRLEKEKKQEQLQQMQKQQQQQQQNQEQQTSNEKSSSSMPLGWIKKPSEPKKIKSLAEIQLEEQQETRQAAVARLAQMKEKDVNPLPYINVTPWRGQSVSWAIAASQCSNSGGFWEETSVKMQQIKPSTVTKSASATNSQSKQPVAKQSKSKVKKEEQQVMKLFSSNNNKQDEFMEWCTKTLSKLDASIDIETFVDFLRNVESALEVRDYCREYLGDSPLTSHFATQFLEKRRLIKPKASTQKDDMSSPAPAITPSSHPSDFQEVKGKGKKMKKSKMTKIDKSILGFSVTAAPDRINVGARDYVEN